MTTALTLNIFLAAVVITAVLGMIAWSIATHHRDAVTGLVRTARPRRRATARVRFIGRTVETRA